VQALADLHEMPESRPLKEEFGATDQLRPFQVSTRVVKLLLEEEYSYPTAVQEVDDTQDTARRLSSR
jgi:hypothetical protein